MTTLFALLFPLAGCAAMMFLCSRMMRRGSCATDTTTPAEAIEIAELRVEVAELRSLLEPAGDAVEEIRS